MMEKVTGLRLEDKRVETGNRVTKTGANQESEEAAGNVRTEEIITGVEDEGEIRTLGQKRGKRYVLGQRLWQPTHNEEPREPYRKGDRFTAMGHTRLQGRTRRERTLETSRRQKWTSRIRTSGVPCGHSRHDSRERRKRRYQEVTREQYRGQPDWRKDWLGGRTKEELFSGSDRWHQDKH